MARTTVFCIVEGQTENVVLDRLLSAHLGGLGIDFHAPIVKLGQLGRGGVKFLEADDLYDQIRRFLRDNRHPCVTTMFDYYGFPTSESKGWGFVAGLKVNAPVRGVEAVVTDIEREV